MLKKFFKVLLVIVGFALGFGIVSLINTIVESLGYLPLDSVVTGFALTAIYVVSGIIFGLIFLFISSGIIDWFVKSVKRIEELLAAMSISDTLLCVSGLLVGLLIAFFISLIVATIPIPYLPTAIDIVIYSTLGYLGWRVMYRKKSDISLPSFFKRAKTEGEAITKILDTCTIIDGRILDIAATGFLEGTLVVPSFVLDELRHIADSADSMRRNRGRRGLDILSRMQKELSVTVKILEKDYEDISEADSKLIRMAGEMGAAVLTTDYNLNKVATVQSVTVLNINDLANAIKPILLPGEDIKIFIVKEGKEQNQGVAYLDDGTMIVVENGRRYINMEIDATVTSVLQTNAGRMIFAKSKYD